MTDIVHGFMLHRLSQQPAPPSPLIAGLPGAWMEAHACALAVATAMPALCSPVPHPPIKHEVIL